MRYVAASDYYYAHVDDEASSWEQLTVGEQGAWTLLWRKSDGLDEPEAPDDEPDLVNHPPHYTSHPSGVECITVTEHMGFNLGNALKYIWRADEKGNALEDLRKARWYVDREIQRRERAS